MVADTVSVCGQVRQGRRISFDADRWFAQYLSNPNPSVNAASSTSTGSHDGARVPALRKEVVCSLLRCAETPSEAEKKEQNGEGRKGKDSGADISFANTAQFLLLSLESVHALTQVTVCNFAFTAPISFVTFFHLTWFSDFSPDDSRFK